MTPNISKSVSKGFAVFIENIRFNMTSVLTIATLIFFYLAVFTVNYSASSAIDKLADIKTIRIFLTDTADSKEMINKLSELQMPADFNFFDKKHSKQRVIDLVPSAKNIAKLPTELFPEFIEMTIAEYAAVDGLMLETTQQIEKIEGVKSVEFGKRVGEKMSRVKRTSFLFMIFISFLTGASATVIIFNTIRLSLYRHQKKLVIYKLVGATKGFITAPYVVSGSLEISLAYLIGFASNLLFIKAVTMYLLKDSYFALYTPGLQLYMLFYIILIATGAFFSAVCVLSFISRLKSINEV